MAIPPFPFEDSTGIFPHSFSNLTVSQDFGERGRARRSRAGRGCYRQVAPFGAGARRPFRWGQYVPSGWVPRKHPWGAAPRGPACPAGVPISPEKWGERGPGASPLDPDFYSRSFPLAGFWDCWLWYDSGAITTGMLRPIWNAFSRKNMLKSIFAKESFQIRARTWGS